MGMRIDAVNGHGGFMWGGGRGEVGVQTLQDRSMVMVAPLSKIY